MTGEKLNRLILILSLITIGLLVIYNYQLSRKYRDQERNLMFYEFDTVVVKVRQSLYPGGDFYPRYYYIEEVQFSDFENSEKLLGIEILADFMKEEDKKLVEDSSSINDKFIFYGQLRINNYHMLKIRVNKQKLMKDDDIPKM